MMTEIHNLGHTIVQKDEKGMNVAPPHFSMDPKPWKQICFID